MCVCVRKRGGGGGSLLQVVGLFLANGFRHLVPRRVAVAVDWLETHLLQSSKDQTIRQTPQFDVSAPTMVSSHKKQHVSGRLAYASICD